MQQTEPFRQRMPQQNSPQSAQRYRLLNRINNGINNDVLTTVSACDACQKYLQCLPPEPLLSDPPPAFAFQDASMDIFAHNKNHCLVYRQRHLGYTTSLTNNIVIVGTMLYCISIRDDGIYTWSRTLRG